MGKVKVGLIGAGSVGKLHAQNLHQMPNVDLTTISDLYAEKIKDWAGTLGVSNVTNDYANIFSNPEIQAVIICSPHETHAEIINAAAKAGKHVFCEKPVSLELGETTQVLKAVKEANVQLQVGFMRRFDHNFKRVYELINEGKIGDPHILKITSRDPHPPQVYTAFSGLIFLETTIHDFDMARYLVGSEVEEVYANGSVLIDPKFDEFGDVDTAVTTLKFKNGALAVIDNSRKSDYGYDQRVEVFGSKGGVTVENDFDNSAVLSTAEGIMKDKPKHFFQDRYMEAYQEEIKNFVDSLLNDREVLVNGNDGLQAELIAHSARKSIQKKMPVKIEEILKDVQGV
jgi:myo-inositol 2-dehydrogenase/D-chiro-inositol 1-dehydrogenase